MSELKSRIIRDSFRLSSSSILSNLLNIIRGFIVAKLLGPSLFGIWNTFIILLNYIRQSDGGLFQGMAKEIPHQVGKGNKERVSEVERLTFSSIFFIALALSSALFLSSFFLPYSSNFLNGLRIVSLIIIFQQVYFYYNYYFRAVNMFSLLSRGIALWSLATTVLVIGLTYLYQLQGALIGLLGSYVLVSLLFFLKSRPHLTIDLKLRPIFSIIKIGFPLLLIGFMYELLWSVDKLLILKMLDSAHLGYYSIATGISIFIYYIPISISGVVFPRVVEAYGKSNDLEYIKNFMLLPMKGAGLAVQGEDRLTVAPREFDGPTGADARGRSHAADQKIFHAG